MWNYRAYPLTDDEQRSLGAVGLPQLERKDRPAMGDTSIQFHKIWIEQCEATEGIRERFGLEDALHYLVGEKLFSFVQASEEDPDFTAELPAFVLAIRRIFSARQETLFAEVVIKRAKG